MQTAKGKVWISIGSIGHIVLSVLSIILGLLIALGSSFVGSIIGSRISDADFFKDIPEIPGLATGTAAGILGVVGTWIGILVIIIAGVGILLAVLCFKRRADLQHSTFPLVIGILYTLFGLISVVSMFNIPALIGLVFSVFLIVGAALNKQQAGAANYAPAGYPAGQPPYGQAQPPYGQMSYGAPQPPYPPAYQHQSAVQPPPYPPVQGQPPYPPASPQPPYGQAGIPPYAPPSGQMYPQPNAAAPGRFELPKQYEPPADFELPKQYDPSLYNGTSQQGGTDGR